MNIIIATASDDCDFGILDRADEGWAEGPSRYGRQATDHSSVLGRLVQIVQANDQLMEELATIRRRIVRARDYLNSSGCNLRFGAENLAYCKSKHRGVLAQLRANRIEANRILGLDGDAGRAAS
jgi:hypothetical protein